ncbi:MAG: cobyrinate a,c-diamide synthase [Gammaproteobacteria bacterium]|nr:cobyrinate a,c-diamide synthase [Gammaproteobacteria bacterium]
MGQILFSAAHKSSGKTIISTGICAALRGQNKIVQPFKKGPDYIDPMWLATASERNCYNLDFWTQSNQEILELFHNKSTDADISIIEANKGLYDGLDLDGSNSNAALAKLLNSPVVLVLDCRGTIRGIAPLLLGYQQFDSEVNIQGVILNFVGGYRHEKKMRQVVEHYTDLKVLGAVHRNDALTLEERYLGLIPSNEDQQAIDKMQSLAKIIAEQIDLDSLLGISSAIPNVPSPSKKTIASFNLRIAYAQDCAFGFYYPDDLEMFQKLGATLIPFDTINDKDLPDADAIFIGGGFPEKCMHLLEKNQSMRNQIYNALTQGLPAYAECGGLMYLCNNIHYQGTHAAMAGVIDANCVMTSKAQGRGYIQFTENENAFWPCSSPSLINAHEFHYSHLSGLKQGCTMVFDVSRGNGIQNKQDGIRINNTLACYAHQRHSTHNPWILKFLNFIESCQSK